jgi:3-(3-hydroxy-phenyl)propionate hydroxylase
MAHTDSIPVWRRIGKTPVQRAVDTAAILVVGGGPVGLTVALDLGRRGHKVILLNRLDFVAAGSKAICFAQRTIEIFDRLGVGDAMMEKGVIWNVGKVYWSDGADPIYQFDLLRIKDQKRPAFINIQQYHVEERLVQALEQLPNVQIRWGHEAIELEQSAICIRAEVRAGVEEYSVRADFLVACDGCRSTMRERLGLDFEGRIFEDNFLIADVKMKDGRPAERCFWFDPPFNRGYSALLHKQPDDVWRLDFQLGWNIDREACVQPDNVDRYVRALLGPGIPFERVWYSIYTFQCRRMSSFVHGRVIFAGDSAHLVSPFGARGCNGGIADADNLAWKLDLILRAEADLGLLKSYDHEAITTADENILNSSRSTDFMTPKSDMSRAFRDAVLSLAKDHNFARPFVNSGRLSTAVRYPRSMLNTPDTDSWLEGVPPGSPALDAPIGDGWLLDRLGEKFVLLTDGWDAPVPTAVEVMDLSGSNVDITLLRARYGLQPGSAYLIRPDHYVAARWKSASTQAVAAALNRAKGH